MVSKANLISDWKFDETSGNAADAHGSNTLTASGSPGTTTGKLSNCRTYDGFTQWFSIADNASLSTGNIDFWFTCWVYLANKSGYRAIMGKDKPTGNQRESLLFYDVGVDRFALALFSDGTSGSAIQVNASSAPSINTWYFISAGHSATNDFASISINAGTRVTTSHSAGVFDSTAAFMIGSRDNADLFWNGRIDEAAFWKRELSTQDETDLYNSGSGLGYDSLTADAVHVIGGGVGGSSWVIAA